MTAPAATERVSWSRGLRNVAADVLNLPTAALLLGFIAVSANHNLKPIMVSSYVAFLGLPASEAGYLVGVEGAVSALVSGLMAYLIARVKVRPALIGALALIALGNVATIFVMTFSGLAVARAIAATGYGAGKAVCAAAVAAFARPAQISALVAIVVALAVMGLLFVIPHLQADGGGVAPLFLALAVLVLPPLALLRWFPQSAAASATESATNAAVASAPVWAIISVIGVACFYVSVGAFWPFVGEIGRSIGLSYETASSIAAIAYIAAMGGALATAFLVTRVDRHWLTAGVILAALATQVALIAFAQSVLVFAVSTIGFMFAWGMFYPLYMSFASKLDPSGRLNGYMGMLSAVGAAIGPTLAGAIIAFVGGGFAPLLWTSSAFILASMALAVVMWLRRGSVSARE